MKFPKSENISIDIKYDSILVIIDKLTKYTHFILYLETFEVKQIVWIILDRVIRYHGILESITLDRNKIFTSKFWQTIIVEIGTKIKLLIVYYL